MEKQIMIYPHIRILFNNKKEWSSDILSNIDESQKHAEWKKARCKSVYCIVPFCEIPDK